MSTNTKIITKTQTEKQKYEFKKKKKVSATALTLDRRDFQQPESFASKLADGK